MGWITAFADCSSKAGVINLTRQLAVDYGPLGVRVNAICPGYVHNRMGLSVPATDPGAGGHGVPAEADARAGQKPITQTKAAETWSTRLAAAAVQPLQRRTPAASACSRSMQ